MCNDLITDEDLKEEGPFRGSGDAAKVKKASDFFNANNMSELRGVIGNMNRDDRISFAKKIFRENKDNIEKSDCISLGRLVKRALDQGAYNRMNGSNMQTSFPEW